MSGRGARGAVGESVKACRRWLDTYTRRRLRAHKWRQALHRHLCTNPAETPEADRAWWARVRECQRGRNRAERNAAKCFARRLR